MQQTIKICILTTAHPIDDVRVNHKFAQSFCEAGFHVTWVGPGHAFFDNEKFCRKEIEFKLAGPTRNRLHRLTAKYRIRPIAQKLSKVDVYYAPDSDSAQLALSLAKRNGAKVIFDIHEIYHGALLDRWLFGRRVNLLRELMRRHIARIASQCDLVLGVSESVLLPYVTDNTSSMVVRSCAPPWFAIGEGSDVCGPERKSFNIMHGKSDMARGTKQVIDAANICRDQISDFRIIMFQTSGYMNDIPHLRLVSQLRELGLEDSIDLRPGVPMQDMPGVLRTCDVGLIAYGRELGIDSLPNRLFEYMAMGLAIIAPVYAREIAKIVDAENCGILVDFEKPKDIADAIIHLRKNRRLCREMGHRARTAFLARHNWESEVRPVIDQIKRWKNPFQS